MKLHQLRQNFLELSDSDQLTFIRRYVEKRTKDIESSTIVKMKVGKPKKNSSGTKKLVKVTDEQLELLKELGLV